VDEAFVRNRTANYHLSIQAGNDGLSHCVLDIKPNRYLALESFTFQHIYNSSMLCETIDELIGKSAVLKNLFKSVTVSLVHERSTLVPSALFEKGLEREYLAFNHAVGPDEDVHVYSLKSLDARNIFSVKHDIFNTFKKHFPNARFNHHSSSLIEALAGSPGLFVHVQASHFEIIFVKGKKLVFYNSFSHQTSEDFIYYLLFTMEQLKLSPENTELRLAGEIEKSSAIYSLLHKYVRTIRFADRSPAFSYAYGFNDVPRHFYFNLLNQYLCA